MLTVMGAFNSEMRIHSPTLGKTRSRTQPLSLAYVYTGDFVLPCPLLLSTAMAALRMSERAFVSLKRHPLSCSERFFFCNAKTL